MSDLLEAAHRVRDSYPQPDQALRRLLHEAGRVGAVSENVNDALRLMPGDYWQQVPCAAADELARLFLALGYDDTWRWVMYEHRAADGEHTCTEDRPRPVGAVAGARLSGP